MKKLVYAAGMAVLMAGVAQAANIALNYSDGDTITTTVAGIAEGDDWQQGAGTVTVADGGSLTFTNAYRTRVGVGNIGKLIIDGGTFDAHNTTSQDALIGNGNGSSGTIEVLDGNFTLLGVRDLYIGRDNSTGLLSIQGGTTVLGQAPTFDAVSGNGSIDFTAGSTGSLTITGASLGYYQGLYAGTDLTYNSLNTAAFGDVFSVTGETITAIPEPATLGLLAAFGGGILFIRRRFMI